MSLDSAPTHAGGDGSGDTLAGDHDVVREPKVPGHPLILLPDGPAIDEPDAE